MSDALLQIIKDLFVTANGRLFFIGSVLSGGSGYYVFDKGSDEIMFAYFTMGMGAIMIAGSMVMASYAKAKHESQRIEIMRLDAELREERMKHGEKDKTIYRVDE